MTPKKWSQPTTNSAAYRRAGGRTRYNKQRREAAATNAGIAMVMFTYQGKTPAQIAEYLNCSVTTVYRYIWAHRGKLRPYYKQRRESIRRAAARLEEL